MSMSMNTPEVEDAFNLKIKSNEYKVTALPNYEPPIGIMPREVWLEKRLEELRSAIKRYIEAGYYVKEDWVKEYNSLLEEVKEYE